jgi:hypothetical protein
MARPPRATGGGAVGRTGNALGGRTAAGTTAAAYRGGTGGGRVDIRRPHRRRVTNNTKTAPAATIVHHGNEKNMNRTGA